MNKDDVEKMINSIDWSLYQSAYGNAGEDIDSYMGADIIPKVAISLKDLFSCDKKIALKATHDLWCCLCHQHSYVSSAALPSYNILMIALDILDDDMKIELLDIFLGFVRCTSHSDLLGNGWRKELRNKLINNKPVFERLTDSSCLDISEFATEITEGL